MTPEEFAAERERQFARLAPKAAAEHAARVAAGEPQSPAQPAPESGDVPTEGSVPTAVQGAWNEAHLDADEPLDFGHADCHLCEAARRREALEEPDDGKVLIAGVEYDAETLEEVDDRPPLFVRDMSPIEQAYGRAMHDLDCSTPSDPHELEAHEPWSGSDLEGVFEWEDLVKAMAGRGLVIAQVGELTPCPDCRHGGKQAFHYAADPSNHHNAAKCPHCTGGVQERLDVALGLLDATARSLDLAVAHHDPDSHPGECAVRDLLALANRPDLMVTDWTGDEPVVRPIKP